MKHRLSCRDRSCAGGCVSPPMNDLATGMKVAGGMKPRSVTQSITERFGGKWWYQGMGHWECDDGVRYVNRVASIHADEDSPGSFCLYYRDGRAPEWM